MDAELADSPEDSPSSPCLIVVDSQDSVDAISGENRLQGLTPLKEARSTEEEIVPPSQDVEPSGSKKKDSSLLKDFISTPSETVRCLSLSQVGKVLVQETSDDTLSPALYPLNEEIPLIIPSSPTEQVGESSGHGKKKIEDDKDCQIPNWQRALNDEVSSSREASSSSNSVTTTSESAAPSSCSASSLQLLHNWQETNQADSSQSARADIALQTSFHAGHSEPIEGQSDVTEGVPRVAGEGYSGVRPHSTSDGILPAGKTTTEPDRVKGDSSADVSSSSQDLRLHLTQSQPETEAEGVRGHIDAAFKKSSLDMGLAEDQFSQLSDNGHSLPEENFELPKVTSSNIQTGLGSVESGKAGGKMSKSLDYEIMGEVHRSKDPSLSSSQPTSSQLEGVKGQSSQQENPLTPSDETRSISKESTFDSNSFHLTMKGSSRISPFDEQGGSPKNIRHSTPIIPEEEDAGEQQGTVSTVSSEFHLSVPSKEQVQAIKESPTKRNTSVFSLVNNASLGSAKKLVLQDEGGRKDLTQEEEDPFAREDSEEEHNITGGTSADTIIIDHSEDTQTYGLDEGTIHRRNGHSDGMAEGVAVAIETSDEPPMVVGDLSAEPNNNDRGYTEVRDPFDFTESQSNLAPSVLGGRVANGGHDASSKMLNGAKKTPQSRKKQSKGRSRAANGVSKERGGKDKGGDRGQGKQRGDRGARHDGIVGGEEPATGKPKRQSSSTSTSSGSNKVPTSAQPGSPNDVEEQVEDRYYRVVSGVRERWVRGKLIRTSSVEISRDSVNSVDLPPFPASPTHSLSSGYMGDLSSMGSRSSSNAGSFQKSLSLGSKNSSSSGSFGKEISPVTTPSPPVMKKVSSTSSSKSSVHFSPELEEISRKTHSPPQERRKFKEPASLKKAASHSTEKTKRRSTPDKASSDGSHEWDKKLLRSTKKGKDEQRMAAMGGERVEATAGGKVPLRATEDMTDSCMSTALPDTEDGAGKESRLIDLSREDSREDDSLLEEWDREAQGLPERRGRRSRDAESVSASPKRNKERRKEKTVVSRKGESDQLSSRPRSKEHRKRGRDVSTDDDMVVDAPSKEVLKKKRKVGVEKATGKDPSETGDNTASEKKSKDNSGGTRKEVDLFSFMDELSGGKKKGASQRGSGRTSKDVEPGTRHVVESSPQISPTNGCRTMRKDRLGKHSETLVTEKGIGQSKSPNAEATRTKRKDSSHKHSEKAGGDIKEVSRRRSVSSSHTDEESRTTRKDPSDESRKRRVKEGEGRNGHGVESESPKSGESRTKKKDNSQKGSKTTTEDTDEGREQEVEPSSPPADRGGLRGKGDAKKHGKKKPDNIDKAARSSESSEVRDISSRGSSKDRRLGKDSEKSPSEKKTGKDGSREDVVEDVPFPRSDSKLQKNTCRQDDGNMSSPLEVEAHRGDGQGSSGDGRNGHGTGGEDLVQEASGNTGDGRERQDVRRSPRKRSHDRGQDDGRSRMTPAKGVKGDHHKKERRKKSGKGSEDSDPKKVVEETAERPLDVPPSEQSMRPTDTPDEPTQGEESQLDILATPPPGSPSAMQDSAPFSEEILKPGTKVLSKWPQDLFYYPSIVQKHLPGNKYQVLFDDATMREVSRSNIIFKEWLSKGQPVLVITGNDFVETAIIVGYYKDRRKGIHGYVIQDAEGTSRRVTKTQVILNKDQAHDLMSSYSSSCSDVTLDNIIMGKRATRSTRVYGSPSPGTSRRSRHGSTPSPQTVKKVTKDQSKLKMNMPLMDTSELSLPGPSTSVSEPQPREPDGKGQPVPPSDLPIVPGDDRGASVGPTQVSEGVNHTLMSVQTASKEPAASGSTPRSGVKRRINKDESEKRDMPARKKLTLEADSPSLHTGSLSPLRRSIRRQQESPVPSGAPLPKSKTLFKGYTFVITFAEKPADSEESRDAVRFSKTYAAKQIQTGGGVIMKDFEKAQVRSGRNVFLIANTYCRTKKYFLALATGIPCLSHVWLNECCRTGCIQNFQDYLLPAGMSEEEDSLVEWHPGCFQVLSGMKVMVASGDDVVNKTMRSILIAAGCELVNTLTGNLEDSDETVSLSCHVVITDPSCPRQILSRARELDIPVVSLEWLMQSLINGRRVGFTRSYKYAWDYVEERNSQ